MSLSGDHPALNFANTVDSRRGRCGPDLLRSFDDVIVLGERLALLDDEIASTLRSLLIADRQMGQSAMEDAIDLREAIYATFIAEDRAQPYPPEALAIIQDAARIARARQILAETDDGFRWKLPFDQLLDAVNLFAIEAAQLLIERPNRRPVRECRGDNCGWLFLDRSKSGRRLWCSDASCGAHSRVKRFRSRQKRADHQAQVVARRRP
ncbi:CGNR zinc finger domain-containing protein [Rhizobium leguminosarum]|uniref:CGNR zinc finger domain-containing protein n=1 Tax=Rhizobium leguminosarum TaxID=384 RepID=UPI0021BC1E9A|nr:ABATE domain-containing protein [Rhizobium leguminosarum]